MWYAYADLKHNLILGLILSTDTRQITIQSKVSQVGNMPKLAEDSKPCMGTAEVTKRFFCTVSLSGIATYLRTYRLYCCL